MLRKKVNEEVEKNILQKEIIFQQNKQAELRKLIGNISHQWRDSLSKIAYINLNIRTKLEFNQEIPKDYLYTNSKEMGKSIDFMSDTMQNFLDYYKPSSNRITFDVLDNGDGVDINTLELFINNRTTYYSYVEYEPGQFHISCKTEQKFAYGQEISVSVLVNDLSENCNLLRESWVFYCGESTGPWFDEEHLLPGRCLEGEHRDTKNIGVQVYAVNNTGINYDSLRIDIGGKRRDIKITPIIYRLK